MPHPDAQLARTRVRRRIALAAVTLLIILALAFTPPLVNVDRYRHRIVQTMSDSMGRPVHIDDVKLHLLPSPRLELRNVVVSEDPVFGAEPTIRANLVLAILRPSSLWRRRMEFSTIRFAVDENGSGPSVNLVRNTAGRWNLDSVLMQAAHVPTAPTAQRRAGPEPRFPYIEAISARVNLKLGNEKMPFSLTDADFALWLPEPDRWHVRLTGRPIRTDNNLNETGSIRLEGTLARAASMAQVPVDLTATWTGAQLGEATALLTGADMGWRGTTTLDAALRGPLGDAGLTSTLELHGLRRDDFIPAHTLDLTITCQALAAVTQATLENPACTLPTPPLPGLPAEKKSTLGQVLLQASHFDLTSLAAADLRFNLNAPADWLLDWARLLTPTIPASESPVGSLAGTLTQIPATPHQSAFWSGTLQGTLTGTPPWHKPDEAATRYDFTLTGSPSGLDLAPVNLATGAEPPLALSGQTDTTGYKLHLLGTAQPGDILALAAKLPPLAAGLQAVLPAAAPPHTTLEHPDTPERLDLTCTRSWSASAQICTANHIPEGPIRTRSGRRH